MKAWWKSKTLWFNFLSAFVPVLETYVGLLTPILGAQATVLYITVIIFGNVALRFVTTTKLSDHDE